MITFTKEHFIHFIFACLGMFLYSVVTKVNLKRKERNCSPKSIFTNSAPLGRVGHRVAMSRCVCVCAIGCSFFLGLSLALRSHDQFQASHWSSLPPSFGNLETWKLGNSVTRKLGNSETRSL